MVIYSKVGEDSIVTLIFIVWQILERSGQSDRLHCRMGISILLIFHPYTFVGGQNC